MRTPVSGVQLHPAVARALQDCRKVFWSVAIFSGVVNLLMLAGPLYMLQVYDRVLGSRNVPTLIALSVFLVGAYVFQGLLDGIRGRIVARASLLLDRELSTSVHAAVVQIATQNRHATDSPQPVRDLDQIRSFLNSTGPIAIVDLPWAPLFVAICFLVHPWLGMLAIGGAAILLVLTILTERASRAPSRATARYAGIRGAVIEANRSNSESIVSMGMTDALAQRWSQVNDVYLQAVGRSSDITSLYGSISKVVRMLLQSAILGLGAYLVIKQELTGGAIIAASIMMGRALAPIETAILNWRSFVAARLSVRRLSDTLAETGYEERVTTLPAPMRALDVEKAVFAIPGLRKVLLGDVKFNLVAGEALGIIGPNGSGKTSVVRALVGVWPLVSGTIRLDGAAIEQWSPQALGRHIGFLSQSIELFDGSVAENIGRMALEPDSELVIKAARAAGAHDMILRMASGYDTRIGDGGASLSAGQRQRIALARALYNDPFLIVLDEPNSNLDGEGEMALQEAIGNAKARNAIVIIVGHRPSALAACDKILYIMGGGRHIYGPRDEVLRKMATPASVQPAAAAGFPPVREVTAGKFR